MICNIRPIYEPRYHISSLSLNRSFSPVDNTSADDLYYIFQLPYEERKTLRLGEFGFQIFLNRSFAQTSFNNRLPNQGYRDLQRIVRSSNEDVEDIKRKRVSMTQEYDNNATFRTGLLRSIELYFSDQGVPVSLCLSPGYLLRIFNHFDKSVEFSSSNVNDKDQSRVLQDTWRSWLSFEYQRLLEMKVI